MKAVEKIVARPITARKITGATLQSLPYSFPDDLVVGVDQQFTTPLLGLPKQLQRLGFTYVRNSLKTASQNNAFVTLAANQFGTTYDSVTGLNAFEAEPAATNLATNSAGAAATWSVSNVADAGTPITGFAASLAFGDTSVLRSAYKAITLTAATVYSVSVFVQMDDGLAPVVGTSSVTGDFSLVTDGTPHTTAGLVTQVGGGLYRVSSARTATTGGASRACGVLRYTTQSARTFRVIGIQVETGSRATSYIATAGATVTRAADVLSCAVANIPGFSAAGYTLVVDGRMDVVPVTTQYLASVTDGTTNNRASVLRSATATQNIVSSGGVVQANQNTSTAQLTRLKIASSFSENSILFAAGGVAASADTTALMPVSPTTLHIGSINGGLQTNGYIYGFKLIPVALNQAQTTALTS